MLVSKASLASVPASFATVSIGTPNDPLEYKLEAISSAGFEAIELGFPDLHSFASSFHKTYIQPNDYPSLCSAGKEVKRLCETYKLDIMMLQPFSNFEGWPQGSKEREEAFSRANGWIEIMQAVDTDMLQVGSSDSPNITSNIDALADDLRELADMLAPHNFRLAYENWCWTTHAPNWKDVWTIVQKVDRPNIGLCLDTSQTGGGEWGDPTTLSGKIEPASGNQSTVDASFEVSLKELSANIPAEKIYLLQISDAYKTPQPLSPEPDKEVLRARGRWSHDFRLYPYNGGYLPVKEVAKAVLETGFRGWFSVEVFDGERDGRVEKGGMTRVDMKKFTKGAMESHRRLLDECADGS